MTAGAFWGCTPREYDAFKDQWEESRRFTQSLYAGLQATLHNGFHFKPPGTAKHFTAEMWMPGYVAPVQTAEQRLMLTRIRHARSATMTPEQHAEMLLRHEESQNRHRLAMEARARGATREEIKTIMEAP